MRYGLYKQKCSPRVTQVYANGSAAFGTPGGKATRNMHQENPLLRDVRSTYYTVWKFDHFSVIWILRRSNGIDLRTSKPCHF